jgi:hypothetical protein
MRNLLYITIVLLFCFTSCSDDFFEHEKKGSTSSENFWKTESDIISASNSMYDLFDHEESFGRGLMWYIDASDDMIVGRSNGKAEKLKNFLDDGTVSYVKDYWKYLWETIKYANDILRNVPDMNEVNTTIKNRVIGEAYFMRGFCYFHLCQSYANEKAGLPIYTEKMSSVEVANTPRTSSVTENYNAIVEDLKKAAEHLPLWTSYAKEDYGRAHKTAANAYLAKTYLYMAQYDSKYYAEAVKAADLVISSPETALIDTDTPAEDYKSVFSIANNWSSEYIWSVVSSGKLGYGSKLCGVMLENTGWGKYNGWGYYQPTNELYEEFESSDPRREATILKFGDEFQFLGETRQYYSENSLSGFQFNKYMEPYGPIDAVGNRISSNPNGIQTNLNVPLMRLAEVYLIKAEALIFDGKNGDVPLNMVRQRSGLAPKTNATEADLKHERRCELAGEFSNRHFDLVRWGDAQETYSKPLHGRIHESKKDPNSVYTIEEVWPARSFNPNIHGVWAIPVNDIVNSQGVITQNEGYPNE